MKQRNNLPLYLGVAVAVGIILGSFFNISNSGRVSLQSGTTVNPAGKLNRVVKYINDYYVDDINTQEIVDNVIEDIFKQLDPHSSYIPPVMHQISVETMNGNFEGIGVQFIQKKDTVVVVKVIADGPSKKSGLLDGDRILMADKDTLFGKNLSNEDIMSKLKGTSKSQVVVKIFRPGAKNLIDFAITRGRVAIKSVPVAYKITDEIGYIKLLRFSMTSADEVRKKLEQFKSEGVENLVLDLRGNPGGFMHIADQIADEFLPNGQLIVYTKNKKGRVKNSVATAKGSFEKGHIYVLVNQNSASASEIISGALQDNDRGTIIGRRTFGKGLVQQEIPFNDGSAMRLTTARYYTPIGRSLQKPYELNGDKSYEEEVIGRYNNGELFHKDSIKIDSTKVFTTPKGKKVYGGGGIVPDVFIPMDTLQGLNYFDYSKINNFVYEYVDAHRKELKVYTQDNFESDFKIEGKIFKAYKDFTEEIKVENSKEIKKTLKESFASSLIGDEMYYKLAQKEDPYILKVKELSQK